MKIGIIGAGNIGSALAGHFRRVRHELRIANSRGPQTLSQVAQETGAVPVAISEVARGVDLLVIAIPIKSVPLLPKDLLSGLQSSSPIIDTGNYYPLRDGAIPESWSPRRLKASTRNTATSRFTPMARSRPSISILYSTSMARPTTAVVSPGKWSKLRTGCALHPSSIRQSRPWSNKTGNRTDARGVSWRPRQRRLF